LYKYAEYIGQVSVSGTLGQGQRSKKTLNEYNQMDRFAGGPGPTFN